MTRHDPDRTSINAALELLVNEGFDGMANAIALLLNEAMKLERSEFLGAGPYERTEERRGREPSSSTTERRVGSASALKTRSTAAPRFFAIGTIFIITHK